MVSRYHWLTPGFDIIGAVPNTQQTVNASLPAGATVKRFQIRNNYFSVRNETNDRNAVFNPYISQKVLFTAGPNNGRAMYTSIKRIPFVATTLFVAVLPVYDWYASAGDVELGVNQKCSIGLSSGAAATLTLQTSVHSAPNTFPATLQGEWTLNFAVLYYL